MPRRRRMGNASAKRRRSIQRRSWTTPLSYANAQKSQVALQTFVTEMSHTAGTSRGAIVPSFISPPSSPVARSSCYCHTLSVLRQIADDRPGHAVAATPATAQLGADDGDDLDAFLA